MSPSRTGHVISAVAAGVALAAQIFGAPTLAMTMIVIAILTHAASLEKLRELADRKEKRP